MRRVAALLAFIVIAGCESVPEATTGSEDERLAVAADIRGYFRDQDIPAYVVAVGARLTISYKVAQFEFAPDTFVKQQGQAGMEKIARAGFDVVRIKAKDANGDEKTKEISVVQYR